MLAAPVMAQDAGALRAALDAVAARDWPAATAQAARAGTIAQDIVEWHRLRAGEGFLGDYEAFLARRADWPGLPFLKEKGEIAVARSTTPGRILAYFGEEAPRSPAGAMALIGALRLQGKSDQAAAVARRAWVDLNFTAEEEAAFLAAVPGGLGPVHEARLDRLLWDGRTTEAMRMIPWVTTGWQALARARAGLRDDAAGVDALVAAVPADLAQDPGLAFERFLWRARKGRDADAAALIVERSASAESLGRPAAWADRRAILARSLMRAGDARLAYRVAADHHLDGGAAYADLEFVAGFIALRKLNDPATAIAHFRRLRAAVSTPISLSRAAYWEGRAQAAAGAAEAARAAYAYAAENQTAFYGLAAAEAAGLPFDAALLGRDAPTDWRQAGFVRSTVFQAAQELLLAGDRTLAKRFALHLAEGLGPEDLARLADWSLSMGEPHLAVLIAKQAADRGVILPRAYFPLSDLVPADLPVPRSLALGIARRESEFDPSVVSPAGARGLMQVMPGTAKLMAEALGADYQPAALTTDPAYNSMLGAAYLKRLRDEFGPALTLVASGYNAGPGRPRRWIEDLGDPRSNAVDVFDWIEHVPFTETRNYIMRVAESVVIYDAKLTGQAGPVRLTDLLRGR